MAATLFPVAARLVLTQPRNPRAARVEALHQFAEKYAPEVFTEIVPESETAMARAISLTAPNREKICVTGSLYLVGEVRQWLESRYKLTGRFS